MKTYKGEPCYFFIDEETYLRPLCLECGKKLNKGWLWESGRYGNWDILCHNCGHIIHKKNDEEKITATN
jgi:DNA-directed RNA polymerase subunit RPC12/RpoP